MKKRGTIILAFVPILALSVALLTGLPALSYLPEYASKNVVEHWPGPTTWQLNTATPKNVLGGGDISGLIATSFQTWVTAPNTSVQVTQGGGTSITAHNNNDGTNLVCFVCTDSSFGQGGDTLAITFVSFNTANGNIVDADLLFNPADDFLTNSAACPSGAMCGDLQTIATHEIGHFLGLDHSPVTSAVMYPFAAESQTQLGTDDVAGISRIYPGNVTVPTGSISGSIKNTAGAGLCGIHVFADSTTGTPGTPFPNFVRPTAIGAMTNTDGTYTITGLPLDSYNVTAEPMDGPVTNTNISEYATTVCGGSVPTNFTTRSH